MPSPVFQLLAGPGVSQLRAGAAVAAESGIQHQAAVATDVGETGCRSILGLTVGKSSTPWKSKIDFLTNDALEDGISGFENG